MKVKVLCIVLAFLIAPSSFGQTDSRGTVSLKDYVDMQIEMVEKMNQLRDEQAREISRIKDENIKTAYAAQDKRLDSMNEFRQQLKDANATYVTWQGLLGVIVGVSGFLFGYQNYKKNQTMSRNSGGSGTVVRSGDQVEVKKP